MQTGCDVLAAVVFACAQGPRLAGWPQSAARNPNGLLTDDTYCSGRSAVTSGRSTETRFCRCSVRLAHMRQQLRRSRCESRRFFARHVRAVRWCGRPGGNCCRICRGQRVCQRPAAACSTISSLCTSEPCFSVPRLTHLIAVRGAAFNRGQTSTAPAIHARLSSSALAGPRLAQRRQVPAPPTIDQLDESRVLQALHATQAR